MPTQIETPGTQILNLPFKLFSGHLDRCVSGAVALDILDSCNEETSAPSASVREHHRKFRVHHHLTHMAHRLPIDFKTPQVMKKMKSRMVSLHHHVTGHGHNKASHSQQPHSEFRVFFVFYFFRFLCFSFSSSKSSVCLFYYKTVCLPACLPFSVYLTVSNLLIFLSLSRSLCLSLYRPDLIFLSQLRCSNLVVSLIESQESDWLNSIEMM